MGKEIGSLRMISKSDKQQHQGLQISPENFFFKFFLKKPTLILYKYVRKKSQTMVKIEFRRDKSLNLIFVRKV